MLEATLVIAGAGSGKTTKVIEAIGSRPGRVEIYVPTHALAEELAGKVRLQCPGKTVVAIGGRSHEGPNKNPLCRRHKTAQRVAAAGVDVYAALCESTPSKKKGKGKGAAQSKRCKYHANCAYLAQFAPADVRIYPHAYLPLMRTKVEGPPPDVAVIDESFFQSCIDIQELQLSELRNPRFPPETAQVLTEVETALVQGIAVHAQLTQAGFTWGQLEEARDGVPRVSGITPDMNDRACLARLGAVTKTEAVRELLSALHHESIKGRHESQAVVYDHHKQTIRVHVFRAIRRFHDNGGLGGGGQRTRILLIDASADPRIANCWFRLTKTVTFPATRNARVVQCHSVRCSTTSLSPKRNADPGSRKDARRRLKQVQQFIDRLAAEHLGLLVVGPQEFTGNPRTKKKGLLQCPPGAEFAHFNAVRGRDVWKDLEAVVVVGRNQPPLEAVESIARCVFAHNSVPLTLAKDWSTEVRSYRLRNGTGEAEVVVHPDGRVQAVLEQLRERESEQAIDRLRLVHNTQPKTVYLLSNLPLDVDVDELLSWDEMMSGGCHLERAWARANGTLPLHPGWLATRFPDLWPSKAAAKAGVWRDLNGLQKPNGIYIRDLQPIQVDYRRVQTSGGKPVRGAWSKALSASPDPTTTKANLEALLGYQIELRTRPQKTVRFKAKPRSIRPPCGLGTPTVRQSLPAHAITRATARFTQHSHPPRRA